MPHFPFPQAGDRYWTPADWAWAGGLLDVLLPSLHHGVPVVARKFDKFDPEDAFALMANGRRAQRLHSADRAAHDARGAESARPLRPQAAHHRPRAASRSASKRWNGASPRSASRSTNSTARPNAIWCSAHARARRVAARRDRQAGARPHRGGDRRRRPTAESRRGRTDRGEAARSGDVPAILGQAGSHARKIHRRLDDHRRPGRDGRGRLFHLRRPRRRRHHLGRLPHRAGRNRGLPDPPSGGGARRRGRQARSRCAPRS